MTPLTPQYWENLKALSPESLGKPKEKKEYRLIWVVGKKEMSEIARNKPYPILQALKKSESPKYREGELKIVPIKTKSK